MRKRISNKFRVKLNIIANSKLRVKPYKFSYTKYLIAVEI